MSDRKLNDLHKEVRDSVQKVWLAGLGALATAEDEGTKLFKSLVDKGLEFENRGKERFGKVVGKMENARGKAGEMWDKIEDLVNDSVAKALSTVGIPSKEEINELTQRVESLTASIKGLKAQKTTRTTTRKTTASKAKTTASKAKTAKKD
jgi:poly(hydroxyalkanoate) granule-associated protein